MDANGPMAGAKKAMAEMYVQATRIQLLALTILLANGKALAGATLLDS